MVMRGILLDELIDTGMQQGGTVDSIFDAIKANPKVRDAVQDAIDNPPPTKTSQGAPIRGANPAQHIRQALLGALQATT